MALSQAAKQMAASFGYQTVTPPKPKVVVGPQNVNLPGYRPGDVGNPTGPLAPPSPVAPAPAPLPPPPPPPPPINFDALTKSDAGFTQGNADIDRLNSYSLADMLKGYLGQSQGLQDNANAHGALFSGAAVNAQRNAAQAYTDAGERQAANVTSQKANLYNSIFDRLKQQLAGGA